MNKEKNVKKAFLWNMIGSSCYSLSSFLYLMVVTRVCGVEPAGFFSLSYATAQLLLTLGRYGMRTYQATDLRRKYLFSEYGVSRILTCGLMLIFGIIYSAFSGRCLPWKFPADLSCRNYGKNVGSQKPFLCSLFYGSTYPHRESGFHLCFHSHYITGTVSGDQQYFYPKISCRSFSYFQRLPFFQCMGASQDLYPIVCGNFSFAAPV